MAAKPEKKHKPEQEQEQAQAKPWGRFKLVSKEPAEESDHINFRNKVTTIGRIKRRCDHVISKPFISSIVRQFYPNALYWAMIAACLLTFELW